MILRPYFASAVGQQRLIERLSACDVYESLTVNRMTKSKGSSEN